MFETLFTYPAVLARHQTGPAAAERGSYLAHCAGQGLARETLLRIARELLVVAERLDVTIGHQITRLEIEAAAGKWVCHQRQRRRGGGGVVASPVHSGRHRLAALSRIAGGVASRQAEYPLRPD